MRPQPHDWRERTGEPGFSCLDCGVWVPDTLAMQHDHSTCPIPYDRNWAEPVEPPCTTD